MNEEEEKANLGLATTETLLRELMTRFKFNAVANQDVSLNINRALTLALLLGSLSELDKEYRTVDHD
jgi:hypothetical protein